ncbi:hypothetical protein A6P39_000670 [Streptomyces sp. FXJ1.172]|uniref:hypothetical protein n=1 Tax=Streptomyces sp. FXJ1.172 TaxID=710705 RepID=UPI001331A232|nr:hypothetical protein [Streptomyces sp. FXJ1.172]WEO92753.1 hypothetical protein A6P39_000670 [Streptomyces sp. FXJ1.172]
MTDSVLCPAPNGAGLAELLSGLDSYRLARQTLLGVLGLGQSNRDPLAEFAEHLVGALWQGQLAESRVQANYDLISADGECVQVKYLANPLSDWPNEHTVRSIPGVRWYALVVYEAFAVTGVLAFPSDLTEICSALGKRHPGQSTSLQLTRRNWWTIRDNADAYRQLGMRIWVPPFL